MRAVRRKMRAVDGLADDEVEQRSKADRVEGV